MVRQFEFRSDFQVTLKAGIGRPAGIHDLAFVAARRDVKTSRTVTRFAAHLLRILAGRL